MKRSMLGVLLAVSLACGARTGLRAPDRTPPPGQPVPPPARCCDEVRTVRVHFAPDPIVPAPETIARVDWVVSQRCATGAQTRARLNCFVTQRVHGNVETSGDCTGTGLGADPATFHVGATTNRPDDIGFELVGALQGQLCVRGTVFLTTGRRIDFGARWWRVQYCGAPAPLPDILWWLRRPDGATESSVAPGIGTASADGCPTS